MCSTITRFFHILDFIPTDFMKSLYFLEHARQYVSVNTLVDGGKDRRNSCEGINLWIY